MILGKSYLGATEASKVYLGATQVYPTASVAVEFYEWSDFGTPPTALVGVESDTIKEDFNTGGWELRFNTGEICGVGKTDTTIAQDGDYCLKLTSTGLNGLSQFYSPNTLTIGKTYRFSLWILNNGTSATAKIKNNTGWTIDTGFIDVPSNADWVYYQIEGVSTATQMDIYIYSVRNGTVGEYIYVDNVSILQID